MVLWNLEVKKIIWVSSEPEIKIDYNLKDVHSAKIVLLWDPILAKTKIFSAHPIEKLQGLVILIKGIEQSWKAKKVPS